MVLRIAVAEAEAIGRQDSLRMDHARARIKANDCPTVLCGNETVDV